MFDIVALGELLVDFTYNGRSDTGMRLFEQNPGGAPANILCAATNLNLKTAFIGKVGQDIHGNFLCEVLQSKNINVSGLVRDPDAYTTLAFVELSDTGERTFSFSRNPGADTCLRREELKSDLLTNCQVFHCGSLSLTHEPARSATLAAIQIAKDAGAIISYDPNYREPLWASRGEAMKQIRSVLKSVDLIKISHEEAELLTGFSEYQQAAEELLRQGLSCVVVTLGKDGAYAATKNTTAFAPALDTTVIDTTGAGDSFWGGFLYRFIQSGQAIDSLSKSQLEDWIKFSNVVAALCIQKRGAIPAMPTLEEIFSFQETLRRQVTE